MSHVRDLGGILGVAAGVPPIVPCASSPSRLATVAEVAADAEADTGALSVVEVDDVVVDIS